MTGPIGKIDQITAARQQTGDILTPVSILRGDAVDAMGSCNGEGEGHDTGSARPSHAGCGCADTMHELANSMTAVLINAQVLDWKLPPYSRLKRPVREIERQAQRSGALLKRLIRECEIDPLKEDKQDFCGQLPSLHGTMAAVTARGPGATGGGPANLPPLSPSPSVPGLSPESELTSVCDPCTSIFFPKEER